MPCTLLPVPEQREVPVTGLVWRLSMRWRAAIDREIAPLGLTNAQYSLLAPLRGMEQAGRRPSQRELASFTGLEPLYVSKLARGLEQAGLIERTGNPADSRAVQLSLTARGRELTAQAVARVVELQDELTAPLGGPDDQRTRAFTESLQILLGAAAGHPRQTGEPS